MIIGFESSIKKETERKCEFPEAEEAQQRPGLEQRTDPSLSGKGSSHVEWSKPGAPPTGQPASGLTSSSATAQGQS